MNRFLKISGILFWIVLIYYFRANIPNQLLIIGKNLLIVIGLCTIVFFVIKFFQSNDKEYIKKLFTGESLNSAINIFIEKLPNPSSKETSNLIAQILIRFTRIGLIAIIIATIPTILLYKQNKLLEHQNSRLKQQTYLQEAERRSSLIFLFSNIMDSIDEELKNDYLDNGKRDLSPQLMGRIISISSRLKPYKFLENGELIETEISPERGQLLITLLASDLNSNVLNELLNKSDFSYSDLKGANLSRTDMSYLNLNNSNLEDANLLGAVINGGNCQKCNFKNANLTNTDVTENNFTGSNFTGSNLRKLNAYNTWFTNCNLSNSNIENTKFTYSFLENVILDSAKVSPDIFDQFINNIEEDSIVGRNRILEMYTIDSTFSKKRNKSNKLDYYIVKK